MSKSQTLRALVNERLTAAAEEIFALFERTIAEYEEEVCRSKEENQRKQELLDSMLSPRVVLLRTGVQVPPKSPGPGLNQDPPQTPRIKEEPEEPRVKQDEHTLLVQVSMDVPESSAVCVKTEESSLLQQRQTELREETQGEDISTETHLHSSDSDNDEDWGALFICSAAQMETGADGDHYNQVQKGQTLTALMNERLTVTAEEMGLNQDPPQTSWIKEEPEEPRVKQEKEQMSDNTNEASYTTDCVPDTDSSNGNSYSEEFEISDYECQKLKQMSITNVTSCSMDTFTDSREPDCIFHDSRAQNSMNNSSDNSTVTSSTDMATHVPPVPAAANGSKYKKRQYCLFCQKPFYKLARHLGTVHRDERDVALAFSLKKGSKKRKEMLRSLKNRGNFSHNAIVASSGFGELVACRRPGASKPPTDFVHCKFCQGLFARKTLWRHMRYSHKASVQGESEGRRRQIYSFINLPTPAFSRQDEMDIGEDDFGEGVSTDQHQIEGSSDETYQGETSQSNTALPGDMSESSLEHSIPTKVVKRRRRAWTHDEVKAVERHMMDFITRRQVPGKRSCDFCLQSEPHALKNRDWVNIKNFVYNRITAFNKKLKTK